MRPGKKGLFYIAKHLLIFFALALVTAVLVRPLQRSMMERMTELRDYLIQTGEDYLGFGIEYASMGPSLFGTLDIRKITVYGGEAGVYTRAAPFITLSRLRLSYSLSSLLKGDYAGTVRGIKLDRPVIVLDSRGMRDLEALAAKFQVDGAFELPEAVTVRVRRGECLIRQGENRFSLGGLHFDAQIRGDDISLRGRWGANLSLALPQKPFTVGMAGRLSGDYNARSRKGTVILNIPSTAAEEFSIRAVNFNIALDEQGLRVTKIADKTPYDLSLNYTFGTGSAAVPSEPVPGRITGKFRADNFSPRELVVLSGSRKGLNQYLTMSISGDADFEAGGGGGISYTANLSGAMGQNFPLGRVAYTVIGRGNENRIHFNRLALDFAQGDFRYTGELGLKPLRPNGTVSVSGFSLTGDGTVDAELAVSSTGRGISVFSDTVSVGEVLLSALDADITREKGGINFELSALRFGDIESWEDVKLSRLSLSGGMDYSPRELQASVVFDSFSALDAANILRPFTAVPAFSGPAGAVIGDIAVTTEVFINTDFTQLRYNASRFVVAYRGSREVVALVSVSGTDRHFELDPGRIAWANGGMDLSGFADFSNADDISFSLKASYLDMPYYLDGMILDRRFLSLTGSYGLSASAAMTDQGGYSGYIEANAIPLPINGQFARLSFLADLRYDSPEQWSASLSRLELADLATPGSPAASLRLSGTAGPTGARFRDLFFDDGRGALAGQAFFSWNDDEGSRVYTAVARLQNQGSGESCTVNGSYRDSALNLRLSGKQIQLGRLIRNANNAAATADVRLSWNSQSSWSLDIDLASLTARNGENDLALSAKGSMNSAELTLQNVRMTYGALQVGLPRVQVNLKEQRMLVDARLWGTAIGRTVDVSFNARADFNAVDSWFNISGAADAFTGIIAVDHARFDTLEAGEPFTVDFSRTALGIALSGGPKNMIRLSLSEEGAFYTGLSAPSPIRGSVTGTISSKTIDAETQDLYVDLVSLWRFIPAGVIYATGGFVNASIQIRGNLADPEFFGVARGHSVRLALPKHLSAEIGPTPMTIVLEGNEMRFGPLTTRVGAGLGLVSGEFQIERWIPNTINLDIRASPETPIPFALDIEGIIAHGGASGHLNIALLDNTLRITGDLTGDDAEITLDTDVLAAGGGEPAAGGDVPTIVDISITTGRKVEFLWPNSNMPILRAYASAGSRVRITDDSVTSRFSVDGDVNLKSGDLYYFQRSFNIREGILSFNENELQFDPKLTIRAEIRDRTDDGPVTISMIMDNAPLLSYTARFEATPALSQFEIFSLLGQSLDGTSSEGGPISWQNVLYTATDLGSQFLFVRKAERGLRNLLRLDMFSFRTLFIPNVVSQIYNPVDRLGLLGNYLDNTSVFLGKYVGTDMFIQGMVLLRYDEFLNPERGWIQTDRGLTWRQYIFEPEIGIELQSPLGTIRWNFSPLHVENYFINDMSFTMSWRWTF